MAKEIGSIKTGGRKKGTPNRKTLLLNEAFENLDFDLPTKISELLPTLTPEKQADILMELLSYLYPKRKPVEKIETSELNCFSTEQNFESTLSLNEKEKIINAAVTANMIRLTPEEQLERIVQFAEQNKMILEYRKDYKDVK